MSSMRKIAGVRDVGYRPPTQTTKRGHEWIRRQDFLDYLEASGDEENCIMEEQEPDRLSDAELATYMMLMADPNPDVRYVAENREAYRIDERTELHRNPVNPKQRRAKYWPGK